jgi:hypothetical protein
MIKSHNNKPYFLPNEDIKPYSPEEMKKWTDEFVQNKSFMMQLLATLTAEGREHWFIAQKHIPLIIKETIFPYLKKLHAYSQKNARQFYVFAARDILAQYLLM